MSLIKCPSCSTEISYNYDICPNCGAKVYDFDESNYIPEERYDSHYQDYVSTTKKTKWYYATILFIAFLTMIIGILWGIGDVMATKKLTAAPDESYILLAGGFGLFLLVKAVIHFDKRNEEF